jgi:tRNA U55 pseudouridine synthase TruB
MTNLVDQLRLAERAKEDIYFAKLDRELIEALHQKALLSRLRRKQSGDHSLSRATSESDERVSGKIPTH